MNQLSGSAQTALSVIRVPGRGVINGKLSHNFVIFSKRDPDLFSLPNNQRHRRKAEQGRRSDVNAEIVLLNPLNVKLNTLAVQTTIVLLTLLSS